MTDLPPEPSDETEGLAPAPDDFFLPPPGVNWAGQTLAALFAILVGLVVVTLGVRGIVLTDFGRNAVMRLLEGAKVGPVGKLHVEGLKGDVFGRFSLARLQIIDARGPWLEVRNLDLNWAPEELIARRLHVRTLQADRIAIARQPQQTVEPKGPPATELPVSLIFDQVRVRVETRPAATVVAGLWDLEAKAHIRRTGRSEGMVRAESRLHAGDGLAVRFTFGRQDRIEVRAEAVEAAGGALAGALGLPVDRPFNVRVDADGAVTAGTLRVLTRSGAEAPLSVDASWGKDGGALDARLKLSASSRTDMFSKRIGPDAHLVMSSRRQSGDRYLVDAALTGPMATMTARGPVDMKRRRADGVEVALSVEELTKWWVPVPHIGPTRVHGVLTGDLASFVLKGDGVAEKIEQSGYKVDRMTGPVQFSHEKGEFRLVSDLKGQGGGGDGLLWTLLGAAPVVHLDGGRIPDGRYIFHTMKVTGSHMDLAGDGGWTLFGGLEFKGRATINRVGLGHAGKGTLVGEWVAEERKGDAFWRLKMDGKGDQLVTGAAEFDRLVGTAPHVTGEARWTEKGLEVEHASAIGSAIKAELRGLLDREGHLGMDVDWSAVGPFGIAPVEIAGAAHGTGKVSGSVLAPRADLFAELTSIDVGRLVVKPAKLELTFIKADKEVDGAVSVTGPSNFGAATGKAAFRFTDAGVELHDVVADAGGLKISGAVTLKDGVMTSADLQMSAATGAFLTSGRLSGVLRLSGRADDMSAVVGLDGQNFALPGMNGAVRRLKLTGRGPLSKLPFDVLADSNDPVAWKFQGSGVFADLAHPVVTLTSGGGKIRKSDFKLLEPAVIRLDEKDRALRLKASLSGGVVDVTARQAGEGLNVTAKVASVSLQGLTDDYFGIVSGTLDLNGTGPHLEGHLDGLLENARSRDAPADQAMSTRVQATLSDTRMHIAATAANSKGLKADLDLDLPSEAAAYPFRVAIDRTKPVKGTFNAEGELRPLWDLLAGGDRSLGGKVSAHGALSGPLDHLRATGDATLTQGLFRDAGTGLVLKDLSVAANFNEGEVVVKQLSGADGHGGSLSGDGRVSLSADGASTLKLTLSKFQLIDNEVGRAQASGVVTVTRDTGGHAKLAGALTIDRADIAANPPTPSGVVPLVVREIHIAPKEGEDAPQPRTSPIQVAFDVTIKAARGIFVRGKGLDAELSLDSHVTGDSLKPDLSGFARLIRGSYDFSGKRFDFDELGTVRLGPTAETIRLDLTARREDTSLQAQILVRGTAAKPEISLTSTPVLPQDEILSRVLFGVSASQLSAFEAAQLASALTSLATGGGFDIIGGLREFARLDRLSLGVDQTTATLPGSKQATTISGGKYLTDNVYVELTGGGRTGPSAQVEVRVRRNLSVISQFGSQGDARLSVRFRQNY